MSYIAFNGLYYLLVCESSSVFVFPDFEEHWLFNLMFSHGQLEFMEFFKEMMFYPTQCNTLGGTFLDYCVYVLSRFHHSATPWTVAC